MSFDLLLLPVAYTKFLHEISILHLQVQYFQQDILPTLRDNLIFWYNASKCILCNVSNQDLLFRIEYHSRTEQILIHSSYAYSKSILSSSRDDYVISREPVCIACINILHSAVQQARSTWNLDTRYIMRQFLPCSLPELPKVLWHLIMQYANPRYCYFHTHPNKNLIIHTHRAHNT